MSCWRNFWTFFFKKCKAPGVKGLNSSSQNYLSNEVLLLILSFFLQEYLAKMYRLPFFLTYTLVSYNTGCFTKRYTKKVRWFFENSSEPFSLIFRLTESIFTRLSVVKSLLHTLILLKRYQVLSAQGWNFFTLEIK